MEPAESPHSAASSETDPPVWTYPTRFCRICREDVPPTITMYPPGVPMQFQTPIVEYKNDDEYGRLIKPCMCRGSLRYIHELCLLRSRTENSRANSMWKCHECGHQFNFRKLTIQRLLSSRVSVTALTVIFMVLMVFVLGFIADPIINIYLDPYDSLTGRESIWEELEVRSSGERAVSRWWQHFAKGFISMGLVGFLKTLLLNPFQFINIRFGSGTFTSTSTRGTTGRDRAVNLSWIAILIGICSAFVLFYRWVSAFVQRSLQRIGNNIVDTQLPRDDDDLKPPPGWKYQAPAEESAAKGASPLDSPAAGSHIPPSSEKLAVAKSDQPTGRPVEAGEECNSIPTDSQDKSPSSSAPTPLMSGSWVAVDGGATSDDAEGIARVHRQGWSFANL